MHIYEALVKERVKNYTHFIYVPVEFDAEYEPLRADPKSQVNLSQIIEDYLPLLFLKSQVLTVRGSVEERMEQIRQFLR